MRDFLPGWAHPLYFNAGDVVYVPRGDKGVPATVIEPSGDTAIVQFKDGTEIRVGLRDVAIKQEKRDAQTRASLAAGKSERS